MKMNSSFNWYFLGNSIAFLGICLLSFNFAACSLNDGKSNDLPKDPVRIIDPSTVDISVFVDAGNVPADGNSYTIIHARISIDGSPAVNVPVLFYSEWGRVFTACVTDLNVKVGDFVNTAIYTGHNGEASTLLEAPVLPGLYRSEQESNTIAAFFLVDGFIFRAINNQNIWQVEYQGKCSPSGSTSPCGKFSARNGAYPVSGCDSVWKVDPSSAGDVVTPTGCNSSGETGTILVFNTDVTYESWVPSAVVSMTTTFSGSGPNECVLDETRTLVFTDYFSVNNPNPRPTPVPTATPVPPTPSP